MSQRRPQRGELKWIQGVMEQERVVKAERVSVHCCHLCSELTPCFNGASLKSHTQIMCRSSRANSTPLLILLVEIDSTTTIQVLLFLRGSLFDQPGQHHCLTTLCVKLMFSFDMKMENPRERIESWLEERSLSGERSED